jgi:hypothetical protein
MLVAIKNKKWVTWVEKPEKKSLCKYNQNDIIVQSVVWECVESDKG